jgi:putative SOS response-associated peptidase YedK
MARRARVERPGALYYVITPKNQRQIIFRELDTEIPDAIALLKPSPPEKMEGYDVSRLVNNPSNDSPVCIRPIGCVITCII